MRTIFRHRLIVAAVALAFAAFGGAAAYAASQSGSNPRQAFLNDVAKRLNVSPQRLTAAIKAALVDRLNAAVKDGKLTHAQANAIEQRIQRNGRLPFFFAGPGMGYGRGRFFAPPPLFGGPLGFGHGGPFAGAASYLGLSPTELFKDLRSGRSLAQIAKARGKSVAGLERAMTTSIKSRLDAAVAAGRISKPQEQRVLSTISSRLPDLINRAGPRGLAGPAQWRFPAPPSGYATPPAPPSPLGL